MANKFDLKFKSENCKNRTHYNVIVKNQQKAYWIIKKTIYKLSLGCVSDKFLIALKGNFWWP